MSHSKLKKMGKDLPERRSVEMETRHTVQVGRNDPCPCGSGRKYKECHEAEGIDYLLKLARERKKKKLLEEQKKAGVPWYRRLWTRATQ